MLMEGGSALGLEDKFWFRSRLNQGLPEQGVKVSPFC